MVIISKCKVDEGILTFCRKGNDGPWSSFVLQVGTPSQKVDVDISIGGQETWVIVEEGCPPSNPSGDQCEDLRGGLFRMNNSRTWESASQIWNDSGIYELGGQVDNYLGLTALGRFGFDTVKLPFSDGTMLPVNHSVVAGIAATKFYVGKFGVSPLATNFTAADGGSDPNVRTKRPSFLSLLKENGKIPSSSFSFTAGSYTRSSTERNALGSFIFGGYDASLIGPSSTSFDFGSDNGRELMVGIQAIKKHAGDNETDLLPTPLLAALDSSQPNIWLPESACKQFESAFGLEWNETDKLYKVNDSLHDKLVKEDATVTFSLGEVHEDSGGESVDIVFPYSAFDLTATWPVVSEGSSTYFPLKKAANSSQVRLSIRSIRKTWVVRAALRFYEQYTLGRTFLQEAYLITDWERRNFSLSQRSWNSSAAQDIVSIKSLDDSSVSSGDNSSADPASRSKNKSLSGGAIAGISIGCVVFAIIVIGAFVWIRRKKAKAKSLKPDGEPLAMAEYNATAFSGAELEGLRNMTNEMDNSNQVKPEMLGDIEHRLEMDGSNQINPELLGDIEHRVEIDGTVKPAELVGDASNVQIHELVGDEPNQEGDEPNLELAGDEPNLQEQRSARQ
ncbi:uncharacterized protein K452DRAFT_363145 [Aplosporella prunicola CBS 121167]|uniref:Peptidase A1 domain-containing protein n=1 Tax=Aplosporella prunicola CBS 121167 TaxID=1176127 RepID=A0A6A6AY22_9PEZI|nr:uncharacterized protein K452DRAFT_363145 [Aplosporella prunicola CBS 121167]KAF2135461.1 hypothetical protein K452DRAFT_363145 [Aplosporella prunicola CBS 121167]